MSQWQTAGKVRMTPRGTWSSTTAYNVLDLVSNPEESAFYIAKSSVPAGTVLTNTTYWSCVVNTNELSVRDDIARAIAELNADILSEITESNIVEYFSEKKYTSTSTYVYDDIYTSTNVSEGDKIAVWIKSITGTDYFQRMQIDQYQNGERQSIAYTENAWGDGSVVVATIAEDIDEVRVRLYPTTSGGLSEENPAIYNDIYITNSFAEPLHYPIGYQKLIGEFATRLDSKVDAPSVTYNGGFFIGSENVFNTDPTRAKTSPIYGVGYVTVAKVASNGYKCALIVWDDGPYTKKIYDSGYQDYISSYSVTGKYFIVLFRKTNGSQNIDIESLNNSDIIITQALSSTDGIINDLFTNIDEGFSDVNSKIDDDIIGVKNVTYSGSFNCTANTDIYATNPYLLTDSSIPYGNEYTIKFIDSNNCITGQFAMYEFDTEDQRHYIKNVNINQTYKIYASYNVKGISVYIQGANISRSGTVQIELTTELSRNEDSIGVRLENVEEIVLPMSATVKSIAHRGDDMIAPQCTAPAYIAAKKRGFAVAENDLWLSSDNEFIMWHDSNLARLGDLVDIKGYRMYTDDSVFYYVNDNNVVYTWDGTGYVSSQVALGSLTRCAGELYSVTDLPLSVLKRIDFGVYKAAKYKGTQILTFEEWVLLCKQLGMEIYVDKKLTWTNEIIESAANIVKKYGMGKYASWLGMNPSQMTYLRTIIPDSRCGVLQHPTAQTVESYAPYNTGRGFFFNGDAKNGMTAEAIQLGLNAGFDVEVWYVDFVGTDEETILEKYRTAVSYGVTGITTDHYRVSDAYKYLLDE